MAGQKRRALRSRLKSRAAAVGDLRLGAAHIGDQVLRAEHAGQLLHEVERRVDGHGQQHHLALARRLQSGSAAIESIAPILQRNLRLLRAAIPAR